MSRISHSLLFVPGDRSERFEKAVASGAHQVIIDLEDAVAPTLKKQARDAVADWLGKGRSAMVRINAADTEWFDDDLLMMSTLASASLMLPKADIESLASTIKALPGRQIIALIETVKGYIELRQVAAMPGLTRIAFGSVDFGMETGINDDKDAMTAIRTQIVLESCLAGLAPPVDGVSVGFTDEMQMRCEARRSRQLGFGGKLCIHPKQVDVVNSVFRPGASQVDWARRVLAAMEASRGAATTVDGKMVDKPVVEQAQRILADIEAR
jgi:citrate lyase subunit beta/citryl-CoA lyase